MAKKRKPLIVVAGSVNMDLVVESDRLPVRGETLTGGRFLTIPGGKGANQAVAAARLGADVYMIGRIGDDAFGRTLKEGLEKYGVDTTFLKTTPRTASGTATIIVQKGGENSIIISPGANQLVTPADINAAESIIRRADMVLMQLEIPQPAVRRAILLARRHGVTSLLDPAPAAKLMADLHRVDIISPNETEAATLLKMRSATPQRITEMLLKRGAGHVVLKMGKAGAIHADHTHVLTHLRGFKIKPVDTTAAGDSFTAGLAVARAEGKNWADAIRFANAAGAVACLKLGAQPSLPRRNEVMRMIRKNPQR